MYKFKLKIEMEYFYVKVELFIIQVDRLAMIRLTSIK